MRLVTRELGGNGSVREIQPKCRIKRFKGVGAKSPVNYKLLGLDGTTPTVHNSLKWTKQGDTHRVIYLTRWEVRFLPKLQLQTKYEQSKIIYL